jgi:hypothetical protein
MPLSLRLATMAPRKLTVAKMMSEGEMCAMLSKFCEFVLQSYDATWVNFGYSYAKLV